MGEIAYKRNQQIISAIDDSYQLFYYSIHWLDRVDVSTFDA